ncbi:hypothetical protein ACFL43_00295 [Thermodesulfobacteriota bacterium]
MNPRSLYLILIALLLSINLNIALADNTLPIFIEPYPNDPNSDYDYIFNLTNQSDCSEVILNHTETITTNDYGRGFTTLNLSTLTASNIPRYMCEYREGSLRQAHAFQSSIFDYLYAYNILANLITANSVTANLSASYGYSYNNLTNKPTIPGDTNCSIDGSCPDIVYESELSYTTDTNETVRMNDIYDEVTTNSSNWNEAYTWGNHSDAGYLKTYTETDPQWQSNASLVVYKTNTTLWDKNQSDDFTADQDLNTTGDVTHKSLTTNGDVNISTGSINLNSDNPQIFNLTGTSNVYFYFMGGIYGCVNTTTDPDTVIWTLDPTDPDITDWSTCTP